MLARFRSSLVRASKRSDLIAVGSSGNGMKLTSSCLHFLKPWNILVVGSCPVLHVEVDLFGC
jgi:hypothetical protein